VHELSVCEAIARVVRARVEGRRVLAVQLRVGALRQVVPDTLAFCWDLTVRDTDLDGARLDVEPVPAELACADCGARSVLSRFVMHCPACGGPASVVAGDELDVVAVEVADPDEADPDGAGPEDQPVTS